MNAGTIVLGSIYLLIIVMLIGVWRIRRKRVTIGPGAAGAMYDLLDDRRRAAIEIILEERTGERDPEDRDGNLPDLEHPGATKNTER
jgi:hypothetical protein